MSVREWTLLWDIFGAIRASFSATGKGSQSKAPQSWREGIEGGLQGTAGTGLEWQESHGQVGGAGRISAAKLRSTPPPNKLWRLMKCLKAPFREKQPWKGERELTSTQAYDTPVPWERDLERCSLERRRHHLGSLESSNSPSARGGVTQKGAGGSPVKEGASPHLPPPGALGSPMSRSSGVASLKGRHSPWYIS